MSRTASLSFRVSRDKLDRLECLAAAMDRPKSWLLERALDSYLETQAWQVAHIEQGLAELDRGEGVPDEEVGAWLDSWGGEDEREPPRRGSSGRRPPSAT